MGHVKLLPCQRAKNANALKIAAFHEQEQIF
jgi:hypothetical protein